MALCSLIFILENVAVVVFLSKVQYCDGFAVISFKLLNDFNASI